MYNKEFTKEMVIEWFMNEYDFGSNDWISEQIMYNEDDKVNELMNEKFGDDWDYDTHEDELQELRELVMDKGEIMDETKKTIIENDFDEVLEAYKYDNDIETYEERVNDLERLAKVDLSSHERFITYNLNRDDVSNDKKIEYINNHLRNHSEAMLRKLDYINELKTINKDDYKYEFKN